MNPPALKGDTGIALEQTLMFEVRQPSFDRGDATSVIRRQCDLRDDRRHPVEIAGGQRVLERRLGIAVQLVPVRGAPVQDGDELRLALGELASEQVAEEVVVAVPLTL